MPVFVQMTTFFSDWLLKVSHYNSAKWDYKIPHSQSQMMLGKIHYIYHQEIWLITSVVHLSCSTRFWEPVCYLYDFVKV